MRDLGGVRCIKGEDSRVLVEEAKIKKRWQTYFFELFWAGMMGLLPTVI